MAIVATKNKINNSMFWTLLIFYVIYWFIFFPIIWFTIQPAAFKASNLATILYALLFLAVFLLLFGIIYSCYFMRTQRNTKPLHEQEKLEENTDSTEEPYFERKGRPVSKRVSIPTVPMSEKTEGVKYTRGDGNRDSTVTIPIFIDDRVFDQNKFVTQRALYFDGASFLGEENDCVTQQALYFDGASFLGAENDCGVL